MSTSDKMMNKCYSCEYRRNLAGDCHSKCVNAEAKVTGNAHGIRSGWFFHPFNFDPVWLESCTGYKQKEAV